MNKFIEIALFSLNFCSIHSLVSVLGLLDVGLEDLEGAHQGLVHWHHGSGVVKLAAEVRSRKQGDLQGSILPTKLFYFLKDRFTWKLNYFSIILWYCFLNCSELKGWWNCDQLSLGKELVAVLHHLLVETVNIVIWNFFLLFIWVILDLFPTYSSLSFMF